MEGFQSTLSRRERPERTLKNYKYNLISIHAPAKGATHAAPPNLHAQTDFNPQSREGSDTIRAYCADHTKTFQSTLPRRERHGLVAQVSRGAPISIHAPAKGATRGAEHEEHKVRYFNPRSREGSDIRTVRGTAADR